MFSNFTGNSRRPRQVNLSGRDSGGAGRRSTLAVGGQHAVAQAHQERLIRQHERARNQAARDIQRTWRGYRVRKATKACWRQQWDALAADAGYGLDAEAANQGASGPLKLEHGSSTAASQMLRLLHLLLHFINISREDDLARLDTFALRIRGLLQRGCLPVTDDSWRLPLLRLEKLLVDMLLGKRLFSSHSQLKLSLLLELAKALPSDVTKMSERYYQALAGLIGGAEDAPEHSLPAKSLLLPCVLAPLQSLTAGTLDAYESFIWNILTIPELHTKRDFFEPLVSDINFSLLLKALAISPDDPSRGRRLAGLDRERLLWLLAYVIFVYQRVVGDTASSHAVLERDYLAVITDLLSLLAETIGKRVDADSTISVDFIESSRRQVVAPLPPFVRQQITSLLNQRNITRLVSRANWLTPPAAKADGGIQPSGEDNEDDEAMTLASYVLTLLRAFPRRADDIRMWLYLGSTFAEPEPSDSRGSNQRLPALKYFWSASRRTKVYKEISQEPRNAVVLIKQKSAVPLASLSGPPIKSSLTAVQREWRLILVFLELYSFVLKVIDDDEFFADSRETPAHQQPAAWTRESSLSLGDVKNLTVFLKNLGFALHWYRFDEGASSEHGNRKKSVPGLAQGISSHQQQSQVAPENTNIAGVKGMTIEYLRGTITGVLRMLYGRDSRRPFLPRDHWLMTSHFDMDAFIPTVVMEEEKRRHIQENDPNADEPAEWEAMDVDEASNSATMNSRNLQLGRSAAHGSDQRHSRTLHLDAVTPRLEILENMPFFIPFATRVKIFREFIALDKERRRGQFVDPDSWRFSVLNDPHGQGNEELRRRHARIRREHVFDDAYDELYALGEGLKEPIQITFVDKFDQVEAGIDGGGVTKEFLTSITKEAFSASGGLRMFVENDKHLLYPNPSALEERKQLLRELDIAENSHVWLEHMRAVLRRYEFLGRIIGKCMYEGILVDVGFVGFFLLKWALTGGTGSASTESGYRANLNDLRDLDESLYQGLLQLKNYPGNVEDFSLDFTITDTMSSSPEGEEDAPLRTFTRELKPNGSNIPVTNDNRLIYISYVARHRLQTQQRPQTDAFLRGLGQVIQPSWLSMFNQVELQTLVSGDFSEIDVHDLREHTIYGGLYVIGDDNQEHPTVQLFWEVMAAFSDADRRKVLKFVTSTPRAPLLGFEQLQPPFCIRDSGEDQERLPSTSTCVNLLKLPRYKDARTLKEKLLYAINSGAGFDLS